MTTRQARARSRRTHALAASVAGLLAVTGIASASPATALTAGPQDAAATPDGTSSDVSAAEANTFAQRTMHGMTLEQKVGQLFVADVWGKSADEVNAGNQKKYGVDTAADVVRKYQVGGVIYFNNAGTDNVDNPRQVAHLSNGLQRAALSSGTHLPLIISTDQEGGRVTRIADQVTEFPSSMSVGAGRSVRDATTLASISGHELRAMGINQNFAPDADVNSNPLNPIIGSRSFSADPALASQLVAAEVNGYQRSGRPTETVASAAKHFPGHGDAATDSHTGLPVISHTEQQWRDIDLPPFQAAVKAGIDVIMTAHITVPSLDASGDPATLSKPILNGLLRGELKYDGVVVTDSLQMQGVRDKYSDAEIPVRAIEAGVDQMLMPPDMNVATKGVLDAVHSGRISEQRIDQSVLRILKLKFKRGILTRPLVDERSVDRAVGTRQNLAKVQQLTDRTTTVLRNDAGQLPLKKPGKVLVTGWNNPAYPGYPADPVTTLAGQLGRSATALPTGASPTADQVSAAVAAAKNSDRIVVLTNGLRTSAAQRSLVEGLKATGKPIIAVTVQEPYDPGFADVPTWVATYDWRDVTMNSLAKVLLGKISPKGKLPVSIPTGADPTQTLFPFGHGMTW